MIGCEQHGGDDLAVYKKKENETLITHVYLFN